MGNGIEIRWIKTGIVAGFCASSFYLALVFAPLPLMPTAALAALLGPAIGISGFGLYFLVRLHGRSVAAAVGAIHNVLAGGLFSAMILVQLAAKQHAPDSARDLVSVWLGLDVAWDAYIGLGTLFFAFAMMRHPRFRWPFAVPGLVIGALVLVLNLASFPIPPAEAGSVDVGPFVGIWYLAVTIQAWRSLHWASQRLAAVA